MKNIITAIFFLISAQVYSQCIVVTEQAVMPVNILALSISGSPSTGINTITLQADDGGGGVAPDGQLIPINITDQNASILASVSLVVGQTTTSGFVNDIGGLYASNFVPYITSDVISGADLLAGTVTINLDKLTQSDALDWQYVDGAMSGPNWVSEAKRQDWEVLGLTDTIFRTVGHIAGWISLRAEANPSMQGTVHSWPQGFPSQKMTVTFHEAYVNGALISSGTAFPFQASFPSMNYYVDNHVPAFSSGRDSTVITFSNGMTATNIGPEFPGGSAALVYNLRTFGGVPFQRFENALGALPLTELEWFEFGAAAILDSLIYEFPPDVNIRRLQTSSPDAQTYSPTMVVGVRYTGQMYQKNVLPALTGGLTYQYELHYMF